MPDSGATLAFRSDPPPSSANRGRGPDSAPPVSSRRRPSGPPVEIWDRYEILDLVGEGGMGAVYKARDLRLGRFAALKFLRGNDPLLVDQFLREARAQARVDHPHVCKVYEVGEIEDQRFLAMQFIDGQPLDKVMEGMQLEQRVKAIRDVAEGLHAAHRIGLVHRDVKPANILVERSDQGGFHPYLVDFGLAREIKGDGRTIFSVEGTPCYMSPEQVEGDLRRLDRRTDVYGLGATLYQALAGEPPFAGLPPFDVIWKVRTEQPRPVRELNRGVPLDLETIVHKCLEKEPRRRYESARALADDLQRYLDGEPIRARPASWMYSSWKKASKHRLAVAFTAGALAALVGASAVAIRARFSAAEEAARAQAVGVLAQELGQDVKEIELFMRYAHALPLHDTTREKEVVRARLAQMERRLDGSRERLGRLSEGPGHYAIGSGLLSLGEVEEAVRHLELALAHGYQAPEASFAAGRARGLLYRRAQDRARRLPPGQAREARQREAAREHLEPALRYLRESVRGAQSASPQAAALIALYEGRVDEALTEAERATAEAPWSYEARMVQGEALQSRATLAEEGGQHERALADLRRAVALYAEAAAMGTSDPLVHEAQGEAWIDVMRIERLRNADLRPAYEEAVRCCERAITADPGRSAPHASLAWAHVFYAKSLVSSVADPRDVLARAVGAAEQAIRLGGPDALAYNSLGAAYWLRAQHEMSIGLDAGEPLTRAVESNRRAVELDPGSSWAYNDAGIALGLLAERASSRGFDPARLFTESAELLDRSIALSPGDAAPRSNQTWFHAQRALYELDHGADPGAALRRAVEHGEEALRVRRDYVGAYNNLGLAHAIAARHRLLLGEPAGDALARAIDAFQAALRLSPTSVEAQRGIGAAHEATARALLARGEDPEPALRAGRQALEAALAAAPGDGEAHLGLGELELTAARAAIASRRSPKASFAAAESALTRAHAQNPKSARPLAALAELHRDRADFTRRSGRPAARDIAEGLRWIDRALEVNPTMPAYLALRASLRALDAREQSGPGDRVARLDLLRRARAELTAAIQENRFLERDYRATLADLDAQLRE